MIIKTLISGENNKVYKKLELANARRQFDFIRSLVEAGVEIGRPFLSSQIIKALNFHAITCLDICAGEYRPCQVKVGPPGAKDDDPRVFHPIPFYEVQSVMDDFINFVNHIWNETDAIILAALVLWRINFTHPFVNGNGRTARAACYYVLCMKAGGVLPGKKTLPELLKDNKVEYVEALKKIDEKFKSGTGALDLAPLQALLKRLMDEQLDSANKES